MSDQVTLTQQTQCVNDGKDFNRQGLICGERILNGCPILPAELYLSFEHNFFMHKEILFVLNVLTVTKMLATRGKTQQHTTSLVELTGNAASCPWICFTSLKTFLLVCFCSVILTFKVPSLYMFEEVTGVATVRLCVGSCHK